LLLISCVVSALLFEAGVRILFPEFAPGGRLKFITNEQGIKLGPKDSTMKQWNSKNEYNVETKFNQHGFRDEKDFEKSKSSDFFVVGDSFSFGWGVEASRRYSNLLESLLSLPVFNISIPGDMKDYKKLLQYAKDKGATIKNLIVGICMENDLAFYESSYHSMTQTSSRAREGKKVKPYRLRKLRVWLMKNTSTYHLLSRYIQTNALLRSIAIKFNFISGSYEVNFKSQFSDKLITESISQLELIIEQYNAFILVIPSRAIFIGDNKDIERKIHENFIKKCRDLNMNVIDMLNVFEKKGAPLQFYYPFDGHWNGDGHSLAAQNLNDAILKNITTN